MNIHASILAPPRQAPPPYTFRHTVSLEETNVVGNVYFSHHISWQGRCRELFIRDHAPGLIDELLGDLHLVTLRTGCEYFEELCALDEVRIEMRLSHLRQHRIGLAFDYVLATRRPGTLAARGFQEIACYRMREGRLVPIEPPAALREALRPYQSSDPSGRLGGN